MRDARINTIGEGANEVLKAFIAVVGSRAPGLRLDAIRKKAKSNPLSAFMKMLGFTTSEVGRRSSLPKVPVQNAELRKPARQLAKLVKRLGSVLPWVFLKAGTEQKFLQSQYQHERLADAAIDLYAASCSLSRLDHLLLDGPGTGAALWKSEVEAGKHFLDLAFRRISTNYDLLFKNDDSGITAAADATLARF